MSRCEELTEELRSLVSGREAGSKLPTVRELLQRYGTSIATFQKAVSVLRSEGVVRTVQGSGLYVGGTPPPPRLHTVDIIYFCEESGLQVPGYPKDLLNELLLAFGEVNISTKITLIPTYTPLDQILKRLRGLELEGVVAVSPVNMDFIFHLQRKKIPHVLLTPEVMRRFPNSVYIDEDQVAGEALRYLHSLGHRRIAYLHTLEKDYHVYSFGLRYAAFFENCARLGLLPDMNLIRFMGYDDDSAEAAVSEMIESGASFTAVIAHECGMCGVYHALEKHGLQVGGDVSVVGIDRLESNQALRPRLTTLEISRKQLVLEARKILEKCFQEWSCEIPSVSVVPRLVAGESAASVRREL